MTHLCDPKEQALVRNRERKGQGGVGQSSEARTRCNMNMCEVKDRKRGEDGTNVRLKKVLEIRALIARGAYRVPADLVAEKMLQAERSKHAELTPMYSA